MSSTSSGSGMKKRKFTIVYDIYIYFNHNILGTKAKVSSVARYTQGRIDGIYSSDDDNLY